MPPVFQNKYVRFAGIVVVALLIIFATLILLSSLNQARGLPEYSSGFGSGSGNMFSVPAGSLSAPDSYDGVRYAEDKSVAMPYYPPEPTPQGYTSGLEMYETTAYDVTGRTKQFDEFCDTLIVLKTDPNIHFKNLNTDTNHCYATLFAAEEKSASTLASLDKFKGVEVSRETVSVTRHKQQIENQTSIIRQQLTSVERALAAAETEFDEIASFAKSSQSARTYSEAIQEKIKLINTLTQQKIGLNGQLNNLYQQAADLQERMNVVAFNVNVSRLNPIYPNQTEQKWSNAWKEVKDQYTDTLIGITAFFSIFLMRALQVILYLLVIIVILRGLWKFAKQLWSRW